MRRRATDPATPTPAGPRRADAGAAATPPPRATRTGTRPSRARLGRTDRLDRPVAQPRPRSAGTSPRPAPSRRASAAEPVRARRVVAAPCSLLSLLAAVLASGGTCSRSSATGALDRPAPAPRRRRRQTGLGPPAASPSTSRRRSSTPPPKVSPAVVTDRRSRAPRRPIRSASRRRASAPASSTTRTAGSSPTATSSRAATSSTVELKDGREFPGTVYGIDTLTDLAIVKIDADRTCRRPRSATPTASRSASSSIAIGSPLGHVLEPRHERHRVRQGPHRSRLDDGDAALDNLIQTDAAINPGNSRRAAASTPAGTSSASTPRSRRDAQGHRLRDPDQHRQADHGPGRRWRGAARPWIGIRYAAVDLAAHGASTTCRSTTARWSRPRAGGTRTPAVEPDSPAATAGLEDGDIITRHRRHDGRHRAPARRDRSSSSRRARPSTRRRSCATASRQSSRSRSGRGPSDL